MSQQLNYLTELLKNVTDGTAARVGLVSSLFKRFLLTHLHDEHDKTVKELKAELAKEQEVHTTVMEALEGANDIALKKKDADHTQALADERAGHAQALADEQAGHAQAMVNLQAAHAAQLARAQNFHLAQLAAAEVRVRNLRRRRLYP